MKSALCIVPLLAACASPSTSERSQAQLLDPRIEVRLGEKQIGANGHTKREVFVFGTKADGTFSTEQVIVGLDRPSAGTLAKTTLQLGPHGASTLFTPCNNANAGCVGPAKVTVARAADPSTIVATFDIDLIIPTHVSTTLPCLDGNTLVYLDGQNGNFIRNGTLQMRAGDWYTESNPAPGAMFVNLSFTPAKLTQGNGWTIWIDTYQLNTPLALGIYENAERSGTSTPNTPGLTVRGNSHSCSSTSTGRFEVHELDIASSGAISKALISFEQLCDSDTTKILEGCFRYEK